jgi:hypothetical protein
MGSFDGINVEGELDGLPLGSALLKGDVDVLKKSSSSTDCHSDGLSHWVHSMDYEWKESLTDYHLARYS